MPEKGVSSSFQFCTHIRGFQKVFFFIVAPKSCEKPQCIFIFLGKIIIFACILSRSKRNDSLIYIIIDYNGTHYLFLICFLHVPQLFNSFGINFGNGFNMLSP